MGTHNEFNSDSEESQLSQHLEDSMLDFDEDLIKQRRIRTFSICESSDQESLSGEINSIDPQTNFEESVKIFSGKRKETSVNTPYQSEENLSNAATVCKKKQQ